MIAFDIAEVAQKVKVQDRCDLKKWGGGMAGSVVSRDGYQSS